MIRKINDKFYKVDTRVEVIGKLVSKDVDRIVLDSDDAQIDNVWKRLVLWVRKKDRDGGEFLKMELGNVYKVNFSLTEDLRGDKLSPSGFINSFKEITQKDEDWQTERGFKFFGAHDIGPMFFIDGTLKPMEGEQYCITSPTDDWGILVDFKHTDKEGNPIPLKEGRVKAVGRLRWYIGRSRRLGRIFKAYRLEYVDSKK